MKIKKVLAILLCFGLVTLSACSNDKKDNNDTNISKGTNSDSEEDKFVTKVQLNAESSKLNDILSSIKSIDTNSTKSVILNNKKIEVSVKLMQWADTRTMSDSMIKSVIENYSCQLTGDDLTAFKSSISAVIETTSDLAKNWKDKQADIEAAGLSDTYSTFTPDIDKTNTVLDAFQSQTK